MALEMGGMRRSITLRTLVGVIILGSLGLVGVLVWQTLTPCSTEKTPPSKPDASADLRLDRVHYTETREGVKEWELEATSAVYRKEGETMILEKIRATFYGRNQESYHLVGEKGKFNTQTKVIEVYDGVKIDSSDGYHIRTRTLKYQADQKELHTSDPVELEGPTMRVEGVGMVVDLNRERVKILGGVTTTLSSLEWNKSVRSAR
jgi:LPS export ABC transporter protein LptC